MNPSKVGVRWIILIATIQVILIFLFSQTTHAESNHDVRTWDKLGLWIGGSFNLVDSNVRLGTPGLGLSVDTQDLLGLDTSTNLFRLSGFWRFSKNRRHRLNLGWLSVRRSGETTLGRTIEIDGTELPLGTKVETNFDLDIIRASYSYSFMQTNEVDLAISGGLYVLPIDFELTASGVVNEFVGESITAPLPLIGFRADIALTPKWFMRNKIELFYLEYDDYKGGVIDTRLGFEYKAFKNVGIGIQGEGIYLKAESESGTSVPGVDFNGSFQFTSFGLMLYLSLYI